MDPQSSASGQQQPRQQPVYSLGNGGHYGTMLVQFLCLKTPAPESFKLAQSLLGAAS
jgi:hypothetical protein